MDNKKLFLHTNPLKLFLKASIPGGISMLMMSVYTVFDAVFVGKFVGSVALGGLGLAMPLVIINFSLADLIGVGSSVPIAILLGKKEDKKANESFPYATLLIIITGIVIGVLLYFSAVYSKLFSSILKVPIGLAIIPKKSLTATIATVIAGSSLPIC